MKGQLGLIIIRQTIKQLYVFCFKCLLAAKFVNARLKSILTPKHDRELRAGL